MASFENQKAMFAQLGDVNQAAVPFHVSSNDAASSSIYGFDSKLGFEGLSFSTISQPPMVRLDSIISATYAACYAHWVLDLQGSELNALRGSGDFFRTMPLDVCGSEHSRSLQRGFVPGIEGILNCQRLYSNVEPIEY